MASGRLASASAVEANNVSFGSKADLMTTDADVRFVPRTDINTDAHEAQVTRASVRNFTTRWTHKGPPLMDGGPSRLLSISYPGCFFE